mgnify:CR=1 FL=1
MAGGSSEARYALATTLGSRGVPDRLSARCRAYGAPRWHPSVRIEILGRCPEYLGWQAGAAVERYPVRFADLRHPPITLVEHRRAQTLLRERGRSLEDEQLIFAVIEEQRALVDAATGKTRDARRLAERRDRALISVETVTIEENDPEHAESGDILDVPTFEVEEWS